MRRYLAPLIAYLFICDAWAVSVNDFAGRTVELDRPAQRIVALAPHIVENVYSAGAGDKLVGVVSYSDYPPAARSIPRIGTYNAFSLEKLVALQPDLVVMWGSGNGGSTLSRLVNLGIPVYVSELRDLADIPESIRRLGSLAGTSEAAKPEAARLERELQELQHTYGGGIPLKVFYQIWHEPLQTVNGEHLISQVLQLCGGRNLFAEARSLAPRISVESVLVGNPDAIVSGGMGEAKPEWLDDWRRYPSLSAVSSDALLYVNPDLIQRPTARILTGARRLCRQFQTLRESQSEGKARP